jgi:VanZ family protein
MKIPSVALRFIAWACVIGLAVASWTPGQEMVRTGFNTRLEHMAAYLIAGIAVIIAYPRRPTWSIAAILCAYAGILELGQIYVPGRHAALLDWLASSSGVFCACVTVFVFQGHHLGNLPGGGASPPPGRARAEGEGEMTGPAQEKP